MDNDFVGVLIHHNVEIILTDIILTIFILIDDDPARIDFCGSKTNSTLINMIVSTRFT